MPPWSTGNLVRRAFKDVPLILGGIEASLRRLAHYDYWSDSLKRSILLDSGADLVSYGMGERSIVQIADALAAGIPVGDITYVDGTVYRTRSLEHVYDAVELPGFEELQKDKLAYARSFAVQVPQTATRSPESASSRPIRTMSTWCRTRPPRRCPPKSWTPSTDCRMRARTTRATRRRAACPPSAR